VRCTHEKQFHEEAAFLTMTYNDQHLPPGGSLDHKHVQLFIKRLRKHVSRLNQKANAGRSDDNSKPIEKIEPKLRYYMCGEYGDKTNRAHYHMCLYGWAPKDQKYWSTSGSKIKSKIYTSETLDKIWKKGNCYIGEVTFESAAYVARYIMKKINGERADKHYETIEANTGEILKRQPEYTQMSLKPGIGKQWLDKYKSDAYPDGKVLARGHKSKTPKYYDTQYKKLDPLGYEDLLWQREQEGKKNELDNTPARLAVKEHVTRAAIAFLKRNAH